MKAIVQDVYGSSEVLQVREIETPKVGDDDVLILVRAAGVHIGDWHMMTGMPYLMRLATGFSAPKSAVRGMDVAGRVESVGKNVTQFRPGDDVFGTCDGAFAEYARARHDRLVLKPKTLSFEQAAAVPVSACTALMALRDAGKLQAGQRVLIIGAGGAVGTFAVQLAKALGAGHVTGVCSASKVELVRSIGADDVIDYSLEDFTRRQSKFDLILDTAGNRPLSVLRKALTPKGTLVIVGGEGGGRIFGGIGRQLWAMILSMFISQKLCSFMAVQRQEDLQVLTQWLEAGKIVPVISRSFPLRQARDAMQLLEGGHARGKVVITM